MYVNGVHEAVGAKEYLTGLDEVKWVEYQTTAEREIPI
jgi:hypothetical protein